MSDEPEQDYMMETAFRVTVIVCVILVTVAVGVKAYFYFNTPVPRNYYGTAPNGVYVVQPYTPNTPVEKGYVYFSMSETSGSELHGKWKVASNVFMLSGFWYDVTLRNNVIVEARERGHMSPSPSAPSNETLIFGTGLGAESLVKLLPFLIGGAIFVLASLVVLFYFQSRKEKEQNE